jgi:hypothetical protein
MSFVQVFIFCCAVSSRVIVGVAGRGKTVNKKELLLLLTVHNVNEEMFKFNRWVGSAVVYNAKCSSPTYQLGSRFDMHTLGNLMNSIPHLTQVVLVLILGVFTLVGQRDCVVCWDNLICHTCLTLPCDFVCCWWPHLFPCIRYIFVDTQLALLSFAANPACIRCPVGVCIIHSVMGNNNTAWDLFVVSFLCVSLFIAMPCTVSMPQKVREG